jgi:hypothetical protein
MSSVSDELVEKVAEALRSADGYDRPVMWRDRMHARAAMAALSTPEFVLPLAEQMLREKRVYVVCLSSLGTSALRGTDGVCMAIEDTLLDAYREAKVDRHGEED